MGLEIINSNSKPNALNETWPVGPVDGTVFGAIHIRNIKTVLKNFYNDYLSFSNWFDSKKNVMPDGSLDSVMLKEAEDADYLNNRTIAEHHDIDFFTGDYPWPMIPRATLTAKGMTYASNLITSAAEDRAATIKACKDLQALGNEAEETSTNIGWYVEINPIGPSYVLPARAVGYLEAGKDIEVTVVVGVRQARLDPVIIGHRSYTFPIAAAIWNAAADDAQKIFYSPVFQYLSGLKHQSTMSVHHITTSSNPNGVGVYNYGVLLRLMYRTAELI